MQFDVFDAAFQRDPYPTYAALRGRSPVHHDETHDFWILSRWREVQEMAGSPVLTARYGSQKDPFPEDRSKLPCYANSIITFDPPDHTRFRRPLQQLFNPRAVRSWPFRIEAIAEQLVGDLVDAARDGRGDAAVQIARPMPTMVFVELMGLPMTEAPLLSGWFDDIIGGIAGDGAVPGDQLQRAERSGAEFLRYCKDLLELRRRHEPEDNLIDNLLRAQCADSEPMTAEELLGNTVFLLLAGIETTDSLIANGLAALFAHQDELRALREDPGLAAGAVEEMLRYDGPAQGNFRSADREFELLGHRIPRGARVLLSWGAANRDESLFPECDGERFRIARRQPGHMGFGTGVHVCLGSRLARLEARAVLTELVKRTATIEPAGESVIKTHTMPIMRGRSTVPVAVT